MADKVALNPTSELYVQEYERATGRRAPERAAALAPLFRKIKAGELLPPRGQQAVDCGFTAHTFTDKDMRPTVYKYYQWVLANPLMTYELRELTAPLMGSTATVWNVFVSDLPEPLTLNQWQLEGMRKLPLRTQKVVVLENNGVAVWLHHLHPEWPLLLQGGYNLNPTYTGLVQMLEQRGVEFAYLGDLDSEGIAIAAGFTEILHEQTPAEVLQIQSPIQVITWIGNYGIAARKRTATQTFGESTLQFEADTISTRGEFVEQEQLIAEYERVIPEWLTKDSSTLTK